MSKMDSMKSCDLVSLTRAFLERKAAIAKPADYSVVSVTILNGATFDRLKKEVPSGYMTTWLSREKAEFHCLPIVLEATPCPSGTRSPIKSTTVDKQLELTEQQVAEWHDAVNSCQLDCLLLKRYLDSLLDKKLSVSLKGDGVCLMCRVVSIDFQSVEAVFPLNPLLSFTQGNSLYYPKAAPLYGEAGPTGSNHTILKLALIDCMGGEKVMYIDPTYRQVNPYAKEKVKFMTALPADQYPFEFVYPSEAFGLMEQVGKAGIDALIGLSVDLTGEMHHPSATPEFQAYAAQVYKMMLTAIVESAKAASPKNNRVNQISEEYCK